MKPIKFKTRLFKSPGYESGWHFIPVKAKIGEKFDPAMHEAVAIEPAAESDLDGTVAQVYQVGYAFKGQMLRPARVVVRQYQGSH